MVLELVAGSRDRDSVAQWLESRCQPRPSIELRDFFAMIEPARFSEAVIALLPPEGGADPTEFARRAEEAGRAIPLIADLARQQREAAGDEAGRDRAAVLAVGMLALYRLAEDFGYEW